MDTLLILSITRNARFSQRLEKTLQAGQSLKQQVPAFQIQQTRSPGPPARTVDPQAVGALVVDFDSLRIPCEEIIPSLQQTYPDKPILCITEQEVLHPPQSSPEFPFFILSPDEIDSSLFIPLLVNTISQAELIQTLRRVRDNLNARLSELQSIRRASLHLTMNLSLDDVLDAILRSALDLINADDTHFFLYEHGLLSFAAALLDGRQQQTPYMNPRPHGITYQVAKTGEKIVVNDVMTHPLFEDRRWEGSIISLPLKIGTEVLGVMNVALTRPHEFTENEIRALEMLGDQASIAIQNAKLYQQAQQEIEERKKAEKAIKHLANHDALTGLPNRRLFNERILLEISHAERDQEKIAVMMFDLDQLKQVNDSFGHNVGDLLLQAVSQRLLGLLRKSDTVARMGGDEFLIILPGMKTPANAVPTAERILSAVSKPFQLEGFEVNITTSIGISLYPDHGEEVDQLLKAADIAMYKAKEKGGNTYHLYTR